MAFPRSARYVTALVVILALGCAKDRNPLRIHLRDFDNGPALADTLKRLVRPGTTIDTRSGKLGSGTPYLQCWQSTPINLGLQRRQWTVTFQYDSAGVRDLFAGYIIQP